MPREFLVFDIHPQRTEYISADFLYEDFFIPHSLCVYYSAPCHAGGRLLIYNDFQITTCKNCQKNNVVHGATSFTTQVNDDRSVHLLFPLFSVRAKEINRISVGRRDQVRNLSVRAKAAATSVLHNI